MSEDELRRLFTNNAGNAEGLSQNALMEAMNHVTLFKVIASHYFLKQEEYVIPKGYDYMHPTYLQYCHSDFQRAGNLVDKSSNQKDYEECIHGKLYGEFINFRKKIDYSWHTNYTEERQVWQDKIVRNIAMVYIYI